MVDQTLLSVSGYHLADNHQAEELVRFGHSITDGYTLSVKVDLRYHKNVIQELGIDFDFALVDCRTPNCPIAAG